MLVQILTGFYQTLSSWTASGQTYNLVAPATASPPYITFGLLTESPIGDFADFESVENLTFYVNCFSSKSLAETASVADAVMNVLDGASITASGFTSMKCVREWIGSPIWDLETGVYMIPTRFRLWMDKT